MTLGSWNNTGSVVFEDEEILYSKELHETVGSTMHPIGTIIALHKSFTNVPTPAGCWIECTGSEIVDSDSPLNGQNTPFLNGTTEGSKRFLRGSHASTGSGGTTTHTHSIGAPTVTGPYNRLGTDNDTASPTHSHSVSTNAHIPGYIEMVWIMRIK